MEKRYLRKSVDITLIAIEVMLSPVLMIDDFEETPKSFAIVTVWAIAFALIGRILVKHSKCLEKLICRRDKSPEDSHKDIHNNCDSFSSVHCNDGYR